IFFFFFFSSRRRHTRLQGDWSSDVCSSDLLDATPEIFDRSHQQASAETPYNRVGLAQMQASLFDVAFLEVETSHVGERSGVIREVAQLLQPAETLLPKTGRAIPAA